ncbi:DUF3846 domain-containing protein [Microbacterium oleivorans]|uniref:DUF3846 domain-containing protein n=1 Tax=Microbacterium oleivorans TaxID=273677 RepID=UPI0033FA72D9
MPWGIVIPADEAAPLEFRLFGQITEYQEAVGGYFQCVDIDEPAATFFCNEDGKVIGLPLNRRASLAWWTLFSAARGVDALMGDVILLGQPDEEGDTQDVPAELVTLLMKTDLYKYEVETHEKSGKWYGNMTRFDNYFEACNAALGLLDRWTLANDIRVLAA